MYIHVKKLITKKPWVKVDCISHFKLSSIKSGEFKYQKINQTHYTISAVLNQSALVLNPDQPLSPRCFHLVDLPTAGVAQHAWQHLAKKKYL